MSFLSPSIFRTLKLPLKLSLGTNLLIYVLSAALIGLGGVTFLFFQILETQLKDEIQGKLSTHVKSVETELFQVKQSVHSLSAGVKTLDRQKVKDAEIYKDLVFDAFQRRSSLVTALGFGQTPSQIVPDRIGFWPYFALDQQAPNQPGQALPAPHQHLRYFDVSGDNYFQQPYYRDVINARQAIWLEPYEWYGMTVTTYTEPIFNDIGQIIGVTGLDINVTALNQRLEPAVASGQGRLVLLSARGNLLADPSNSLRTRALTNYQDIPLLKQLWHNIGSQQFGYFETDEAYIAYQRVQGTQWLMIAIVPFNILQPVFIITLGGSLLAIIFFTGIILLFIKKLNNRLQPIITRCYELCNIDDVEAPRPMVLTQHADELDILEKTVEYMAAQLTATLENLEDRVIERTTALSKTLQTLQQTQSQLIQSEKMSSLGEMVAGIAHEINNPNNFIHGNLPYLKEYTQKLLDLIQMYQAELPHPSLRLQEQLAETDVDFVQQDLPKLISSMTSGTNRIRSIVNSLRTFSRLDEAELKSVDLHSCIDSTLVLLESRLKATSKRSAIQIIKTFADNLPNIECYAGELNQVFFNLIANAIEAIEAKLCHREHSTIDNDAPEPGRIQIQTCLINLDSAIGLDSVGIWISDNGVGIPEEIKPRIFDPFFTTKPVGQGTGLGLAISYQVITETHKGRLSCDSTLGEGSTFYIEIPLR